MRIIMIGLVGGGIGAIFYWHLSQIFWCEISL